MLADGRYVGDDFPWMDDAGRASFTALSDGSGALAAGRVAEGPATVALRMGEELGAAALGTYVR